MEESVRLPLPTAPRETGYQDCLCRECLHSMAEANTATAP
jgi:hypothetical protein